MDMTSKRTLESRLESLEDSREDDGLVVAYRNSRTGEPQDSNGEPIDENEQDSLLVVITQTLVLPRKQAERENREILGPAEDASDDVDAVKVAIDE